MENNWRTCNYTGIYNFTTKDKHLFKSTSMPSVEVCIWKMLTMQTRPRGVKFKHIITHCQMLMTLVKVEEIGLNTKMIILGNGSTSEILANYLGSCFS